MKDSDPIAQFADWYRRACASGIDKPNAMTLATIGADGRPAARIVLLSSFDADGFVFHTNYASRKGSDLAAHPRAALVFWWDPLGLQVRIEGRVEKTRTEESDAYFAGRPRGGQLGAWASDQSQPIPDRLHLESRMAALERQHVGQPVPRPPHWGGYRLVADRIEFWENRDNRLHDRMHFQRGADGRWRGVRLAP